MQLKRYLALLAAVMMMVCLGGSHGWSALYKPLMEQYGIQNTQTQLTQSTSVWVFCILMIFAGRLHDRFGPRPLAIASGIMLGSGYLLAHFLGGSFPFLWLALGVLCGAGSAAGYVCPIATAVKWFPDNKGLVCGIAAAGFGFGPVVLSSTTDALLADHWHVLDIFGFFALAYGLLIVASGAMLATPPAPPLLPHQRQEAFRVGGLLGDRRFWVLVLSMLCGTFPYLIIMGRARLLPADMGMLPVAAMAIPMLSIGSASGRIGWGFILDRIGQRRTMLAAQTVMVTAVACLFTLGAASTWVFLPALFLIGSCYGSCFAIMPATVARQFGTHLMGTIYPLIMFGQALSSLGQPINGYLVDTFHSPYPGLGLGLGMAACGLVVTWILAPRATAGKADLPTGNPAIADQRIGVPEDVAGRR